MGNCCTSYGKVSGNCAVCLYECNTRACKCQFMHKECCLKYMEKNGNICFICKSRYCTFLLEKEPMTSTGEQKVLQYYTDMSEQNKKIKINKLKKKAKYIVPMIVRFFHHYNLEPRNPIIALESMYTVSDTRNKYKQYCMNKGKKAQNIRKDVETIQILVEESRDSRSFKDCITKMFNRYRFTFDTTSESDIEVPLH